MNPHIVKLVFVTASSNMQHAQSRSAVLQICLEWGWNKSVVMFRLVCRMLAMNNVVSASVAVVLPP
jgi:hypothetical protein